MATVNLGKIQGQVRGVYNESETYRPLDYASYLGILHICQTETTGTFNIDDWVIVVDESIETIVDVIGDVTPANIQWDVEIPFNDSLNIARGYGTHDQIDVSAAQDESIMVDLPTKSVDFSRASGAGNFNKSGEYVELVVDEPAIGSDGLGVFGTYVNAVYPSQGIDPDNDPWDFLNVPDIISFTNGVSDPFGGTGASTITTEGSVVSGVYKSSVLSSDSGTYVNISVWLKGDVGGEIVSFGTSDREDITITDEWVRYNTTRLTNNGAITIYSSRDQTFSFCGVQAVDGISALLPYIPTTSSPATHSPDIASIPMRNNMPATGEPFTIVVDCEFPLEKSVALSVFSEGFVMWRFSPSSVPVFRISDDLKTILISLSPNLSSSYGMHRYSIRYDKDADIISGFFDGIKIEDKDASELDWSQTPLSTVSNDINIGSGVQSSYLNSTIKNFRIIHRALSDEEIKSLGVSK